METLEHELRCGTDPGKTHYHLEQHRLALLGFSMFIVVFFFFPINILVKFNKKNTGIFTRKRKRKIPIICQKNSEISPGKKPLVPSSPPQNILGSTLCGVWDVPDF